ncbi:hypothetical protein NIN99_001722 [Campylobacter coli]|nr:hypothetical protein [Campylobacter coli]
MEVKLDNTAKEKLLIQIDKASGGFQRCLKRLQGNFNFGTSILTYDDVDLGQIIKYSQYPAGGGFEDRFKEIKRCIDEQSKL